jgi:multiple sugar transport system ATP-binding protein
MNFFDAGVIGATGAKTAGIRPEHLRLGEGPLTARVTHVERLGGDTNVFLRLPSGEAVTVRRFGQHDHAIGEDLRMGFDPGQLYLFDDQDRAVA